MEASIFPVKTAVTYSKVDKNFPYTILAQDETGSLIRIYLRREDFPDLLNAMILAETEKIHCELASTIARAKEEEQGQRD